MKSEDLGGARQVLSAGTFWGAQTVRQILEKTELGYLGGAQQVHENNFNMSRNTF